MAKTQEQMQALERSLAYEFSTSMLNALLIGCKAPEGYTGEWLELNYCLCGDDAALLHEAMEYLEWRGLIDHAAGAISIHDEQAVAS